MHSCWYQVPDAATSRGGGQQGVDRRPRGGTTTMGCQETHQELRPRDAAAAAGSAGAIGCGAAAKRPLTRSRAHLQCRRPAAHGPVGEEETIRRKPRCCSSQNLRFSMMLIGAQNARSALLDKLAFAPLAGPAPLLLDSAAAPAGGCWPAQSQDTLYVPFCAACCATGSSLGQRCQV